ncbi:MAG: DNA polymerase III subunit chi [Oleiphilaceae bacterium]|nr:DNA polymerase III subunit chi [Oleiphilaceae bacterium]
MSANKAAESDRSYWFHILAQTTPAARLIHAARLAEKAYLQGDRVGIICDSAAQAEELDDLLWQVRPDAFIPHTLISEPGTPCSDPVGILLNQPTAQDWDTVIILSAKLPADADQFKRLALVAQNDPEVLNQARQHFKQLRAMGIEPRVHDQRKTKASSKQL